MSRLIDNGYRNFNEANTRKLRMALSRAQAHSGRARLVFIGDSFCSGFLNPAGALTRFGKQLTNMLAARGMNVRNDGFTGDGYMPDIDAAVELDPRISYENQSHLYDPYFPTLGGLIWSIQDAGDVLSFQPDSGKTFDTVDMLVPMNNVNGPITVRFHGDSGSGEVVIDYNGGGDHGMHMWSAVCPSTVTSKGRAGQANSVSLVNVNTHDVYVTGINCRDSTDPGLEVIIAGVAGGRLEQWSLPITATGQNDYDTTVYDTRASLNALCADSADVPTVFIVQGYANDMEDDGVTGDDIANYANNLMDMLAPWGDVIWLGYTPMTSNFDGVNLEAMIAQYNEVVFAAAIARGYPVVDTRALYPDFQGTFEMGLVNDYAEHPSPESHAIIARSILAAFDSVY